jgi:hypothetical protein
MNRVITVLLLVVALINFAPVLGVISVAKLTQFYQTPIDGNDLAILMRHRAVLFGIVGGFMLCAVFRPELRHWAIAAGFVNMLSFVALAWATGDYGAGIRKVMMIDIAATGLLVVAAGLEFSRRQAAWRTSS